MSKEAASTDLQAAAYWKQVAGADCSKSTAAVTKVAQLTTAALGEEKDAVQTPRRTSGLRIA